MISIVTGRTSAYNQVSKNIVPWQGKILTAFSKYFFDVTKDIYPNWVLGYPHPDVIVGKWCEPHPYEYVFRNYLYGSLHDKFYAKGIKNPWGFNLPEGFKNGNPLPDVYFTPTKKSETDPPISWAEILNEGYLSNQELYSIIEIGKSINEKMKSIAKMANMVFVDFKLEFGWTGEKEIILIDAGITPHEARFWEMQNYVDFMNSDGQRVKLRQVSKEFYRKMVTDSGFDPSVPVSEDNIFPMLSEQHMNLLSTKYAQVYNRLTGNCISMDSEVNKDEYLQDMYEQTCEFLNTLV